MTEPIRVLHVVGSLGIGGIQSYLMELYRYIDRKKVQFDFVVNIKTEQSYADEIIKLGGRIYYIVGDAFEKKKWRQYILFWKSFFKEHSEYRIVHGHLRSTAFIYLWEAKRAGLYTIAHSHATSNGYGKSAWVKDLLQWPVRYIADYCMGCSEQANVWMFGKKRTDGDACIVLHNAIDVTKFVYNESARNTARLELGVGKTTYVIGTVGRLIEQKNQQVLIEAMSEVLKVIADSQLLIVGDGPIKDKLVSQINSLGLEMRVRLLGSRNDVDKLLNAFDLFALPSKDEGLGISAIEAQANGLPVLISDAVPEETRITEQVTVVHDDWSKCIVASRGQKRKDVTDAIRSSGYDIKQVSTSLTSFYMDKLSETGR